MQGNAVLAGVALAIAALSVSSFPAAARLAGADREDFIKSSFKSCGDAVRKDHPSVAAKVVESYCTCMAEAEAEMTTDADIEYMNAHSAPPADYRRRVQALAPACNQKAGAK
jgi:hypothetical protein